MIIYSRDLSKWPLGRPPELPKHRISSGSLPVHHLSISEPPPNRNHATLCYQGFAITAIAIFHGLISTSNIQHLLDKVVYRRTLSPSLFSIPAPHAGSYPGVLFNSNSNIGTFEKYPDLNGLLRNNISAQPAHSVSSKKMQNSIGRYKKSIPNQTVWRPITSTTFSSSMAISVCT